MPERIFVYGILMREAREAAILPDYRLTFDGFATIEPHEGQRVLGGIIETDRLDRYDSIEGVNHEYPEDGYYQRIRVTLADGSTAWAYRMNRRGSTFNFGPHEGLVKDMQREYERLGHDLAA